MPNPLTDDLDHVLSNTTEVWKHLRRANLFITGGTGFVGSWLLETFAWACDTLRLDATATVLTRSPAAFRAKAPHLANHPAIRLHNGDIRSFEFPAGSFTHVIHAAGATPQSCVDHPAEAMKTTTDGTTRVLKFAVAAGVRRFLLTSSGAVYGAQPQDLARIPEVWGEPGTSATVYGESKRMAEVLCTIYAQTYGLQCLLARCFDFVGPYLPLNNHFAIGSFIDDHMHGRPIQVDGDGASYRSYMYAADLAVWLWTILAKGKSLRPYNVGSEFEISTAETAEAVASELQSPHLVRIFGRPAPGAGAERYVPSTARARNELQLRESVPLQEAIRRTAAAASVLV